MSAAKILNTNPTDLELSIAQAFLDLEASASDLKSDLRVLQFKSAREIDVAGGKKAIAIFVPVPSLSHYHKVQQSAHTRFVPVRVEGGRVRSRLIRELEKKFASQHVVILAERRILPPASKGQHQKRPRSRTLTSVHDKILEDLVFPTEIVGKRVRYLTGGNKLYKVMLDGKDAYDEKLESFSKVYERLTGKQVTFEIANTVA